MFRNLTPDSFRPPHNHSRLSEPAAGHITGLHCRCLCVHLLFSDHCDFNAAGRLQEKTGVVGEKVPGGSSGLDVVTKAVVTFSYLFSYFTILWYQREIAYLPFCHIVRVLAFQVYTQNKSNPAN